MIFLRQKIHTINLKTGIINQDEFKNSIAVTTRKAGKAFGDIALKYKLPRTTSARCKTKAVFASLTRISYNNIIMKLHD